ncbi:MAG: PorT family protein [Cyclobacteriaceae bacterium]|nr:PorT family protein [Cyclobacteriaceae bacterium]
MKHTHRLTLLLLAGITLFSSGTYSQPGVQVGFIGLNHSEGFITNDSLSTLGGPYGFTGGILFELPLTGTLSLQPALNWVSKNWSDELDDGIEITKTKMVINYLEIPVQLVLRQPRESGFFVGLGPSLFYGLSGKRTVTIDGTQTRSDDYVFGSEEGEQRITLAFNVMAGYAFGKLKLNFNYSRGITNQPGEGADFGNEDHFALRIGYLFSIN